MTQLTSDSDFSPQEYGHLFSEYLEKHPNVNQFVLSDDADVDPELEEPIAQLEAEDQQEKTKRSNARKKQALSAQSAHQGKKKSDKAKPKAKTLREVYDGLEASEPVVEYAVSGLDPGDTDYNRPAANHHMFHNAYDHISFGKTTYNDEFEKIKVLDQGLNQYKSSLGRRCLPFDWVAVHWTAKMDDRGHPRQVENSYESRGEQDPMVYQLGHYYSMKCWEMAAVTMHAGEQFQLECPEHFAHGGAPFYADGDDAFQVPPNTDLTYNLNIIDCQNSNNKHKLMANLKAFSKNVLARQQKDLGVHKKQLQSPVTPPKAEKSEDEEAEETVVLDKEPPLVREDKAALAREKGTVAKAKHQVELVKEKLTEEEKVALEDAKTASQKQKVVEEDQEADVDADALAEEEEKVTIEKTLAEQDAKRARVLEEKIKAADDAVKEEEAEIEKENKAAQLEKLEKKEVEEKHPTWETTDDLDVEIRSPDLKDQIAGNYQKSNSAMIHEHPVWIKVEPTQNRIGYYQDGSWIIAPLSQLKGMLEDVKEDPDKSWGDGLATSVNQAEDFPKAIWFDGKSDLLPKAAPNSDGGQIVTAARGAAAEPAKKKKAVKKAPVDATTPGPKADQEHAKVVAKREAAIKQIEKAVTKVASKKAKVEEPPIAKVQKIEKDIEKSDKGEAPRKIKRMGTNNCFSIQQDTDGGESFVLEVDPVDKYAPRVSGVYNVHVQKMMDDLPVDHPDRAVQLWSYHRDRKALVSRKYPSKGLFEGFNRNLIVYKYKGLKNQVWSFDLDHAMWFNDFTKHSLAVEGKTAEAGGNVITEPFNPKSKDPRHAWKLAPCK